MEREFMLPTELPPPGSGSIRRGKWKRIAAIAILGSAILISCSGTRSTATEPSLGTTPPTGGGIIPSTEFTLAQTAVTAATDAQGVYPAPGTSPVENTPAPKAAGTPGDNSVFLPAIVNERPPDYPFELQTTGVMAIQGFFGCNWEGVAGQVFDLAGIPLQNLILHLEGTWAGKAVTVEALTGSAAQYGPAGYEFVLGTQTLDSTQSLWVQVLDATHKAVSARVYFDTYNDCARNLILVNFDQVR
jgi:hypothetical protein